MANALTRFVAPATNLGMTARDRLIEFMAWRGWSKAALASAVGVDSSTVSKVVVGQRGAGLALAVGIERVTAAQRDDGEVWPTGPIRAAEWVCHPTSVDPDEGAEECQ